MCDDLSPHFHRMIAFAPRINSSKQRSDTCESMTLKQQCDFGRGSLVRTRTIDDDVPVVWKLMATRFDFVQNEVDCSLNDRWVAFQLRLGTQIKNDRILTGFQLLTEFRHGNSRHAQLAQQASPLPVFVGNVKRDQSGHQTQRAAADMGNGRANLFYLIAEQIAETKERTSVKERAEAVKKEELSDRDSRHSCQRRRYCAHARHKFRRNYSTQAISREYILRPANTRVGFKRNSTKKVQNLVASIAPQIKPKRVRDQAGNHRGRDAEGETEFTGGGKRARSQQQRQRWDRQPHLFHE